MIISLIQVTENTKKHGHFNKGMLKLHITREEILSFGTTCID